VRVAQAFDTQLPAETRSPRRLRIEAGGFCLPVVCPTLPLQVLPSDPLLESPPSRSLLRSKGAVSLFRGARLAPVRPPLRQPPQHRLTRQKSRPRPAERRPTAGPFARAGRSPARSRESCCRGARRRRARPPRRPGRSSRVCRRPWIVSRGRPASRTWRLNAADTASGALISSANTSALMRVGGSRRELLGGLGLPMHLQGRDRPGIEGDRPSAPGRLGLLEHADFPVGDAGLPEGEFGRIEVDVCPSR
jgi:hypothetical protein